jgi:hypothetical protein
LETTEMTTRAPMAIIGMVLTSLPLQMKRSVPQAARGAANRLYRRSLLDAV